MENHGKDEEATDVVGVPMRRGRKGGSVEFIHSTCGSCRKHESPCAACEWDKSQSGKVRACRRPTFGEIDGTGE